MDLQSMYALTEKGPSAQKHGVPSGVRKQRASSLVKASEKTKDQKVKQALMALAGAIEDGEARIACELFGKLSKAARKLLPRNLAVACGEGNLDLWPLYDLL